MQGPESLRLTEAQIEVIRSAAAAGYPDEVCGIIVGRERDGVGAVVRVVPTRNVAPADLAHRYEIPPADLVHEQRTARESGMRILGFYHSHPDHGPEPSRHDLDLAWPEYVYVIVPTGRGTTGEPKAWRLTSGRGSFEPVPVDVARGAERWA